MADDEKKGAGSPPSDEKSAKGSEFQDIEDFDESEWAGALDEWDSTFDGIDPAEEPSQPVTRPAAGVPEEQTAEPKREPEPAPVAEPVAAEDPDQLTDGELDFDLEEGEALGEMLSAETQEEPPAPEEAAPEFEDMVFDESTRLIAPDDQLRLAQAAMEHQADEELGLDFDDTTRLISSPDQERMVSESLAAVEPAAEPDPDPEPRAEDADGEVAEVTLTVDDEFYDDFSIEDDAPPPEELDFGAADSGAAPVEPLSDDVTPARPHMAVPPDALRDDGGDGDGAEDDMDDALEGLLDQLEAPAAKESLGAEEPAEVSLEAQEPAEASSWDEELSELSFEDDEPAETPDKKASSPEAEPEPEDEEKLSSLDDMLGLTDDAPEPPIQEAEGGGDLASLDALLGIADAAEAAGPGPTDPDADQVSRVGMDLPDPPGEPQLGDLPELATRETLPAELPALEALAPLAERPLVDGFPATLEPAPQPAEQWERVVELISGQVDEIQDASVAARLQTAAGEVLEFRLARESDAMVRYQEASALDGSHRGCRRALLRSALGVEDWGVALESLEVLLESSAVAERGAYRLLAADLALATMGDADRSLKRYEDLLERPALRLSGLLGQLDVAVFNGDQQLLAVTLSRLTKMISSDELVAPVALEAGRRSEVQQDDAAAAIGFERATAHRDELAVSARDGLARLAVRAGRWDAAAERLAGLVAQLEPGDQRTDAAVVLGRILSHRLDRRDEAVTVAQDVAREDPARLDLQIRLARLCQEAGQWELAVDAWTAASEAARDPHLQAVTCLWAGLLREQFLDDAEGALECFRGANHRDASLAAAGLAMGDVLGRSEDAEARIEARLAQASAAAEPADQAAQQVLAAREMVAAERPQEALQLMASARASGLDSRGLLRDLVRLAVVQGDADQACDVLLQLGELVEPEAAVAVRSRAVSLAVRGLEEGRHEPYRKVYELDAALSHLGWGAQRALRAAGDSLSWDRSLAEEAESSAEAGRGARIWRLLGITRRWSEPLSPEAPAAFEHAAALDSADAISREALAAVYGAEGRWEESARLLGEAAEATTSATEGALLQLRRAACLEQRLDAADQAAEQYRELGERYGGWSLPMDTLVRLRVWSGDRLQTAEILKAQAAQAADDSHRAGLLVRAAAELDFGGDMEGAAQLLGEARSVAPEDPLARVAHDHLEQELGNWSALADRALTAAKDAEDDAARLWAYEELARIDRDGREDFPSAVLGFESIVRMAPDHHASLRELELYYPAEQRFNDLGAICGKIAAATEGAERAANALEWARCRQEANQRDELVEALRMAVRAAPESLFALARLEGHALREGWADELALINRAVADQYRESPTARAVFLRRAAESHEADGAAERAVEALTEAIEADPGYLPAAEERLRLELVSERWPGVVEAAEALAKSLRRPEAKATAYLLAGAIAQERVQDLDRAIAGFEAAAALQPDDRTAYTRLRQLYEQREAWPQLAQLINGRLEVAESAAVTCELLWELAQVERDRLNDREAAKATLKRLISLDGDHLEGVRAATELYAADEQFVEVADMLIRQARLEQDPDKLTEIFFDLGVLYDEKIPDPKRAAASFSKVVSINQRDVRALERLSVIHVRNEEWKGALAVTGRLVETETDPAKRIDHLITLSQILEGGYRDPRRAREALLKAVEVDPQSLKAVGELASFYGRQNDRRSLMVHLDRSVTNVRNQLLADPFQGDAYRSLLKLFEWRRAPDQQACAAAALTTIGEGGDREREILATVGRSRPRWDALKDPELDEILYPTSVNSGFRHTMRMLGGVLGKPYRVDLSTYGASRGTRVPKSGHPLRDVANQLGAELGVTGYDLHVVSDRPGVLVVESFDPPAIIVGASLVEGATPAELAFIVGRCMKVIQSSMVLPAKLKAEQLQALVAGIVRQYQPDFEPTEIPPVELLERTKVVAKAMPRKMKSELMPFALGCAGITDFAQLSRDVARVANMAGLLACGDLGAAVTVLLRMAGKTPGEKGLGKLAKGLVEIEQLLQFGVSEEYFELRRRVGLASGSGPRF